jgi:hypothetical protein
MESNKTLKFIEKAKLVHADKYNYSEVKYVHSKTKIKIACPKHGIFEQQPSNHLTGNGCPKCNNKIKSERYSFHLEDFINKAKNIHGDRYDYFKTIYVNIKTNVKIICIDHGEFEQLANNHLNGRGCRKCGIESSRVKQTRYSDDLIHACSIKHKNFYDYSLTNYINKHIKIKIICPKHGIFEQLANNHLNGHGCPICKYSKGELKIKHYLTEKEIVFIPQKRFKDCKDKHTLPFDFYLPDYNVCIEYNGEQHYTSVSFWGGDDGLKIRKKRDKIKNKYCKDNNIILIIIKYDEDVNNKLKEINGVVY